MTADARSTAAEVTLTDVEIDAVRSALRLWLPFSYEGAIKYLAPAVERIVAARLAATAPDQAKLAGSGRPSNERDGACICNYNPETTDGPDECCPFHGRPYVEWIERGDALQAKLAAVEALADLCAERREFFRNGDAYMRGSFDAYDTIERVLRPTLATETPANEESDHA